jgi:hypothetical protein
MNRTLLSTLLAFTALGSAQAAQAQAVCVAPADAADAVVYVMPTAYDAALKSCNAQFRDGSFLAGDAGKAFIAPFRSEQDARWGGTYRFLKVFIASQGQKDGASAGENDAMMQMLGSLSEEQLRPFVDAFLSQMLTEQIKPDSCAKIDRGIELLSPLPVENVGGLVAFALEQAKLDNPPVCTSDAAAMTKPEASAGE